jgi:hypothetical protein
MKQAMFELLVAAFRPYVPRDRARRAAEDQQVGDGPGRGGAAVDDLRAVAPAMPRLIDRELSESLVETAQVAFFLMGR